jgi:hypothetical protein
VFDLKVGYKVAKVKKTHYVATLLLASLLLVEYCHKRYDIRLSALTQVFCGLGGAAVEHQLEKGLSVSNCILAQA